MTQMKSFAELKRFFAEPGAAIVQIRHDWLRPDAPSQLIGVERRIQKVQSNAVQFEGGSWFYYPKAKEIRFTDEGFEVCLKRDGKFAQIMAYRCQRQPVAA